MATKGPSKSSEQSGTGAANSNKSGLRKPVFVKVDSLKPGTNGHTLIVKVLTSNTVLSKKPRNTMSFRGSQNQNTRIAECLIGDETGTILFTARNNQVDLMKPDNTLILRNAKIDMFKGSMRLAVDKWGRIEVTEPENFVVKEDNNLSLVEYELVDSLKPGTNGHTLIVKVLTSNTVLSKKPRNTMSFRGPQNQNTRIAECLIGDETGTILFTARNNQVDLMKPDNTLILRNAKIDMFKGSMRLAVDKWGRIEVTEPENFVVKEDNNLSLVEYELVNVVEES
ncbi:Nucleic acid-binding [Abeliophyllum distichum]|uniref:Nucleic acid-binding n=1 Tax=Abeliophyllum distichum TaxID=126358 RepID=A0ABD1PTV8_9LAMI